jgi:zinc transport system permease protein
MLQLFTTDFFIFALVAGVALALIAGPLGCFIVWRRMSYFGDTLAHSALLGIAIGLMTGSNLQLSLIVSSVILATLLAVLDRRPDISSDTLLGILAHSALAFGVVLLALTDSVRVDIEAYLFGAMLTITSSDLLWIVAVSVLLLILLSRYWNDILSVTVHQDLAEIDGLNAKRLNMLLVIMIALTVAVSMKIVGVLLITSLLIIPPATARRVASSPEQMALTAAGLGVVSVVLGLLAAFALDTPAGPTVVVMTTLFFALSYLLPRQVATN